MSLPRSSTLVLVSLAIILGGCSSKARKEFERQLQICSAGEQNGVLAAAAEGCGNALDIARASGFPREDISDLSYRLGQIERKRGRFEEAEILLWPSLKFESYVSDSAGMASRLVELALSLAGQDRWDEGARLLDRAEPYVRSLEGGERKAAVNTLRGYAAQLGSSETAMRFAALALELDAA